MKVKYFKVFVSFIILFIGAFSTCAQNIEINSRHYKKENGGWYLYYEGKKCDRIVPDRLIVRKKSKEKPTNFDLENLNISDTKIFNKRYTGGYFVLNIDESKNPLKLQRKFIKALILTMLNLIVLFHSVQNRAMHIMIHFNGI